MNFNESIEKIKTIHSNILDIIDKKEGNNQEKSNKLQIILNDLQI